MSLDYAFMKCYIDCNLFLFRNANDIMFFERIVISSIFSIILIFFLENISWLRVSF